MQASRRQRIDAQKVVTYALQEPSVPAHEICQLSESVDDVHTRLKAMAGTPMPRTFERPTRAMESRIRHQLIVALQEVNSTYDDLQKNSSWEKHEVHRKAQRYLWCVSSLLMAVPCDNRA